MSTTTANDDFFTKQTKKQSKKNIPRVYIGNLPLQVDKSALQTILPITNASLEIVSGPKNCHAFITCASNKEIDDIISSLHQTQFQGRTLTVQREKKGKPQRTTTNNNKPGGNTTFGGWAKPKSITPLPAREEKMAEPVSASESMAAIITEEFQAASSEDDVIHATLASLAAVSFLAPALNDEDINDHTHSNNDINNNEEETKEEPNVDDFMARCKKPLSELMSEFGEHDPNWQSVQPTLPAEGDDDEEEAKEQLEITTENRLGRHGKAPIHVEFVSFGYTHGAPGAIRNGWSHAQPLSAMECRDLPPVPGHLSWRDGTSGFVQKSIPEAWDMGHSIAEQALDAIVEAIDEGNHGYAAPLQMKIYVGSEAGRHRSVVVCEQAAKKLRNLLRNNQNNRVAVPVSVGTFHRDLERSKTTKAQAEKSRGKKDDFE
jgi:hypothetical protein